MNFNDLQTFLAVADHASFSLAAKELHITQPAVSKRIQNLERRFATPLFDRVGKRVYLTQAGNMLVPRAQQMLATLADTQKNLADLADNISGHLNLATSHHIGLHRLAPVLREFSIRYPQVQLNISFEDSEVAHEMVRHADIELAVVTLNPAGDKNLNATPVWHDPLVFVDTPERSNQATMTELAHRACVLPGPGTFTGRIVLQRFADANIELTPNMSTNYLETIGMLVSVGLGWSVLPQSMTGELNVIKVRCPAMSRSLGYITNPGRTISNAARAFIDVTEEFGQAGSA